MTPSEKSKELNAKALRILGDKDGHLLVENIYQHLQEMQLWMNPQPDYRDVFLTANYFEGEFNWELCFRGQESETYLKGPLYHADHILSPDFDEEQVRDVANGLVEDILTAYQEEKGLVMGARIPLSFKDRPDYSGLDPFPSNKELYYYQEEAKHEMKKLSPDDHQILRQVSLEGYKLVTWDAMRRMGPGGQSAIGYEMRDAEGVLVFRGEDFGCSTSDPIDSDECLRGLLSFLTLRPGDVESSYFEDYTPRALRFVEEDAETLSLWSLPDGPEFIDLE